MKTKLFIILLTAILGSSTYSQSITNTLGSSGSFIIRDDASTFFTLEQATGLLTLNKNMSLPSTTSSTLGIIFKGNDRFLHDFKASGTDGYNTFVGINAGNFTMGGSNSFEASYNTAVGHSSLSSITTGNSNSAFGWFALSYNTTGFYNSAFGMASLQSNTTGIQNSAFGLNTLRANTEGGSNCAFGGFSLRANTTGSQNSAFGSTSLNDNTTGSDNSAFGVTSLYRNTNGYQNTAIGGATLDYNTIGFNNSAFGYAAGVSVTTGSNLTLIGYNAEPSSPTTTGEITLGNYSVGALRCNVPSISSLSDARDKKNIQDLKLGIDFLMKLQPRQFNWDKREWYDNSTSDGSKMQKIPTAGFIAQELDTVQMSANAEWLNLVLKSNPNKLEATSGNLLPIIVKAIQDLKRENDQLKAKNEVAQVVNENLKTTTDDLKERLIKFENMQTQLVAEIEKLKSNNDETTKVSLGTK
ncbi:MAG: tail fiber domain-containing protein [Ignavibacteria bacterium]|nr:tail fiber domain-containing protein [Ignavibacteria bacterium]